MYALALMFLGAPANATAPANHADAVVVDLSAAGLASVSAMAGAGGG